MALPEFTIDLGNGIHLDSSGVLTSATPDGKSRFALSAPLPIPSAALQQAFSGFKSVVPNLDDILGDVGLLEKFKDIGLTEDVIATFGKVAKIASTLASVIPFVNIAAGLLSVFSSFGGADPMRDLITQEFNRLFARIDEIRRNQLLAYTGSKTAIFDAAVGHADDYRKELAKPKAYLGTGELARKLLEMEIFLPDVESALGDTLLYPWTLPFDPSAYRFNWGSMAAQLYTGSGAEPPVPANLPGGGEPFDHRPMVQLLVFGIQSYLTFIKAFAPEYRTTSQFSTILKTFAGNLSKQLDKMREQTLARTIYQPDVAAFRPGPRQWFIMAVGALDLRADSDEELQLFWDPTPVFDPTWDTVRNMHRTWSPPPPIDVRGHQVPVTMGIAVEAWWTISTAAAQLANQQSERDYAELLTRSGYFTLAHLEGLLRHLSTEPDSSETVTVKSESSRKPMPASPVKVSAATIPFSPPIEATASREPQQFEANLYLTTLPIGRPEAIGYRLRWITLPSHPSETPFDFYVWTDYVTADAERNWKLRVNENPGLPLDPISAGAAHPNQRLFMDARSPETAIDQEGTVTLTADTFDWYVAVADDPIRRRAAILAGVGSRVQNASPKIFASMGALDESSGNLSSAIRQDPRGHGGWGWESGEQTWKGDKREWQHTQIEISYRLFWKEDQLSIALKTRPQDRNYLIYLVVEEYLQGSQQYLRTPVPIRVNGQLTYVPQAFFDAEAKARKHANDIIGRIERNYSKSRQPGPSDPVISVLKPGILESAEAMREFADLAQQHAPDVVAEAVAHFGRNRR